MNFYTIAMKVILTRQGKRVLKRLTPEKEKQMDQYVNICGLSVKS